MNRLSLLTNNIQTSKAYVDDVYYSGQYYAVVQTNGTALQSGENCVSVPINMGQGDPYWNNVSLCLKATYADSWKCFKNNIYVPDFSSDIASRSNSAVSGSFGITTTLSFAAAADATQTITGDLSLFPQPNFIGNWCVEAVAGCSSGINDGYGSVDFISLGSIANNYINFYLSSSNNGAGSVDHSISWNLYKNGAPAASGSAVYATATGFQFRYVKVYYDGTNIYIYVDGFIVTSFAFSGFTTNPLKADGYTIGIGAGAGPGATGTNGLSRLNSVRYTSGTTRSVEGNVYSGPFPEGLSNTNKALCWFSGIGTANNIKTMIDTGTKLSKSLRSSSGATTTGTKVAGVGLSLNKIYFEASNSSHVNFPQFVRIFKESPKFFSIASGAYNQTLTHSLGVTPSLIILQPLTNTNTAAYVWCSQFTGGINGNYGMLNSTAIPSSTGVNVSATSTTINCSLSAYTVDHTAYLFADDPSANGIIRVTSFTTNASGNASVNLGWEPQFALIKSTSAVGNWIALDIDRNWYVSGTSDGSNSTCNYLDTTGGTNDLSVTSRPTSTGFDFTGSANTTYMVMAIRRSNKPPTSGTQVFKAVTYSGDSTSAQPVYNIGFPPDLVMLYDRFKNAISWSAISDKLRGPKTFSYSESSNSEVTNSTYGVQQFLPNGVTVGDSTTYTNVALLQPIAFMFKRAYGFMDIVCFTGTATTQPIQHNLGTTPKLIFSKARNYGVPNTGGDWAGTYFDGSSNRDALSLNKDTPTSINAAVPCTSTTFDPSKYRDFNGNPANNISGKKYFAILFASKAGICDINTYTGNGTSKTINCGFTGGARFILIKRIDTNGSWYVFDTTRGIVAAAADPFLTINNTNPETNSDIVDPSTGGFIVNQDSTNNLNVNGALYLYMAIS